MKTLINKKTRGFSLVELMVVVAIMGTLAAIAIPAYNEYRKSAKKAAYKSDLNALHKGWLAFGVELDSFCRRETAPEEATVARVGMESLTSSKLYGKKVTTPGECAGGTGTNKGACEGTDGLWIPVSSGPGKHNFIGFGTENCTGKPDLLAVQLLGEQGGTATIADTDCDLGITTYEMGVFGHLSGADYYGISINNNGVLSSEFEDPVASHTADSKCV